MIHNKHEKKKYFLSMYDRLTYLVSCKMDVMEGGIFKKYASYLKQQPRNHISTIPQPNYG